MFGLEKAAAAVPEVHSRIDLSGWSTSVAAQRQELEAILREMVSADIVALASPEVRLAVLLLGSAATCAANNAANRGSGTASPEIEGNHQTKDGASQHV